MLLKWAFYTFIIYIPLTLGFTWVLRPLWRIVRRYNPEDPDGIDTGVSFEERRRARNFILWTFGLTIFCAIFQWLFMYFTDGGETLRAYLKLTM